MKKLMDAFWAKAVAILLCTACVIAALACFSAVAYAQEVQGQERLDWLGRIANPSEVQINWIVITGILLTLAAIALYVFLLCAAGRRGSELPRPTRLERVPFDLLCALALLAFLVLFFLMRSMANLLHGAALLLPVGFGMAGTMLLILMLSMSLAVRIKTDGLWRNNIIAYVLVFLWRILCDIARHLPLLWKGILAYLAFGFLCICLYSGARYSGWAQFLFLLVTTAILAALCMAALQAQRLQKGARALAAGDLAYRIDTKGLRLDFKAHAQALNGIGDGMRRAVEERTKSERMKTDLIANVSHDLKTPLTSIVNYIDLLQKEALDNETAKGYVEVLARQAQRLKKLTEDIVEASKASSGAIGVNVSPTDVKEILHQSLAEYAEKLATAPLTPVVRIADDLPAIRADGRLAWRVLDNLLNNACKYALPGTRLYCEAAQEGGRVALTLKNVSREPIGVSGEELAERFVRGDAARASEGSGLGLSIAKSLMELQGGVLRIEADGDLFRATLFFAKAD